MSPTPLPSLRELFPNLLKPRGDDPKMASRLITPQLVLDKGNPSAYLKHNSPTTLDDVSLTRFRRDSDPEHEDPPSEASLSTVDTGVCHRYLKTRKHICHRCGKQFNRPSSLTIHYHIHTGERPYPCPYPGCLRTFNVSSNMRRHYKNHDFRAKNRSRSQTKAFQTSFYCPPVQPDEYPPPPLQWGFR